MLTRTTASSLNAVPSVTTSDMRMSPSVPPAASPPANPVIPAISMMMPVSFSRAQSGTHPVIAAAKPTMPRIFKDLMTLPPRNPATLTVRTPFRITIVNPL
jgi:hypothetical protein